MVRGHWHEHRKLARAGLETLIRKRRIISGDLGARKCAVTAAVNDPAAVIIDGAMPPHVRAQLVAAVRTNMAKVNTDGINPFVIAEGTIGIQARALGAASLPLFANFMVDRDVLLKEEQ